MILTVPEDFITYRAEKAKQYNQRGRTERKFLMDIDCELYEFLMIKEGIWDPHESWMVDAVTPTGTHIDVKFIQKYWNLSGSKITNILQQRRIIDEYQFMEWKDRPKRPFEAGDEVECDIVGELSYDQVADNIRPSFKAQGQYYLDARRLL